MKAAGTPHSLVGGLTSAVLMLEYWYAKKASHPGLSPPTMGRPRFGCCWYAAARMLPGPMPD